MAGHSKWSKVKHFKGPPGAQRAKTFCKLTREITVASQMGGGDPAINLRLRPAILSAPTQEMPNDNKDCANPCVTGETAGSQFEGIVYEDCEPGTGAVMTESATEDKNRAPAALRLFFTKFNDNLAMSGSVSYMFQRKEQIAVACALDQEYDLLEIVLDTGAGELTTDEDHYLITTAHHRLYSIAESLKEAGIATKFQKHTYLPETTERFADESAAAQVIRLSEALEDNDNVLNVYSNFHVPEEIPVTLTA